MCAFQVLRRLLLAMTFSDVNRSVPTELSKFAQIYTRKSHPYSSLQGRNCTWGGRPNLFTWCYCDCDFVLLQVTGCMGFSVVVPIIPCEYLYWIYLLVPVASFAENQLHPNSFCFECKDMVEKREIRIYSVRSMLIFDLHCLRKNRWCELSVGVNCKSQRPQEIWFWFALLSNLSIACAIVVKIKNCSYQISLSLSKC